MTDNLTHAETLTRRINSRYNPQFDFFHGDTCAPPVPWYAQSAAVAIASLIEEVKTLKQQVAELRAQLFEINYAEHQALLAEQDDYRRG